MTLQIKSTDTISGIPIKKVRSFFRFLTCWHKHSFELSQLQEKLSLDGKTALALVLELVGQGYLKPPDNGAYQFTEKGEDLVRASAAGTVSRKTVETALAGLLERVDRYNSDPNKILRIETVVVFGSFLGTKERLGDLDVAVKCRDRNLNDPDRAATALAYAERSGRQFSNFAEWLYWPNTELFQILRARKRTVAIQDWDTFLKMAAKHPGSLQYKVVFGSTEEVVGEIRARLESMRNRDA